MSLETTLTQAIGAIDRLRQTVDGKVQEIDNRIASKENEVTQFLLNAPDSFMKKTFYVDELNGSDTNDGSHDAPFQTIQKAADSVPVGGFGDIHLVSDYVGVFKANFKKLRVFIEPGKVWTIPMGSSCVITGSQVTIANKGQLIIDRGDGSDIDPDNYAGFCARNSKDLPTIAVATNLYLVNWSTNNPTRIDADRALFGSRYWEGGQDIQMNLAVHNLYSDGDFIIDGLLLRLNGGCGSFQWNSNGNESTFRVVDSGGTAVDVTTKVSGIVKDANGVPRNIASNLVL